MGGKGVDYLPVSARFGNVEAFFIRLFIWPFGGRPFREDEAREEEGDDGERKLHFFLKKKKFDRCLVSWRYCRFNFV